MRLIICLAIILAIFFQIQGCKQANQHNEQSELRVENMESDEKTVNVELFKGLMLPMLTVNGVDSTLAKEFSGFLEGITLPSWDLIADTTIHRENVQEQLQDTYRWIQVVVKPEWLIDDLEERFIAVPEAIEGGDVLVAAWTKLDRRFQVIVTQNKLHFLVNIVPPERDTDDAIKSQLSLNLADQILRLPPKLNFNNWHITKLGHLILLNNKQSALNPFVDSAIWYDTLTIVTDGTAAKYSVTKNLTEKEPLEVGGVGDERVFWFPR